LKGLQLLGEILIHNIAGQVIRKINIAGDVSTAVWDLKTGDGHRCKPGIYVIKQGQGQYLQKIIRTN